MLTLFPRHLVLFSTYYVWAITGFSLLVFFRTLILSPLFYSVFTGSKNYKPVFVQKHSKSLNKIIKPYTRKTKTLHIKKFRLLSIFSFAAKQKTVKPVTAKSIKQVLDFSSIFSKIQFFLNPLVHPFTGTKLHMNSTELKWKKSWDKFIRSFFVKRVKRWYFWEKKMRKKNILYKTLERSLLQLARFLKKSRIKKLKRWERRRHQVAPKFVIDKPTKPFFLDHLFYFYRLRFTYKRLRFVARHFRSIYPKHLTKFKFKTPYFFLHQPFDFIRSVVPMISSVVAGFKKGRSLSKTFKRVNWRKKKRTLTHMKLVSHQVSHFRLVRRKIKKLMHLKKYKLTPLTPLALGKKWPSFQQLGAPYFLLKSKFNTFFVLGRQKITERFKRFLRFRITRWRRKRRYYRYKIREWAYTLRFTRRVYRRKISNGFSHIRRCILAYITNKLLTNKFNNLRFEPHVSTTQRIKKYLLNSLPTFANIQRFEPSRRLLSTMSEISLKLVRKLFIYPEYGLIFILPSLGFFLLSHTRPLNYFRSHSWGIHRFRKLKYSFALRNELPKHILRKYAHAKLSLEHFLQSRLSQKLTHSIQPRAVNAIFKGYEENWADSFFSNSSLASTFVYPATDLSSPALNRFEFKFLDKAYRPLYTIYTTRFKPGYMRLWRRARASLQVRTKTFFRYQHQLTHYLLMYKRGVHLPTTATDEFKVQNLLVKARFVLDRNSARLFVLRKLVFVNGLPCTNLRFQLFAGDFLQLIISFKYYIVFRWLLNHNQKLKIRIKSLSKKIKQKKAARNPDKTYRKSSPEWVSRYTSLFSDVAKYMEVDFFTLSTFLLHDPLSWNDVNVYAETILKPQIFNMYNWKYIN